MLRPAPAESRTCRRRAFAAVRIAGRLRSRTRPAANARRTRGRVRCLRCGRRPPGPAIRKQKREGRMPPAFERLRPSGNGAALPKRPMRCGSATWGCPTGPENRKSPLPEFIPAGVKSLKSDLLDNSFFIRTAHRELFPIRNSLREGGGGLVSQPLFYPYCSCRTVPFQHVPRFGRRSRTGNSRRVENIVRQPLRMRCDPAAPTSRSRRSGTSQLP